VLALERRLAADAAFDHHIPEERDQPVTDWVARKLRRRSFAFTASPATDAYRPERVVDGYQRPYGGPHLWSSAALGDAGELREAPQSLLLEWPEPVRLGSVRIVFNDDVDEDLVNLHHHRTDFEVVPELVTDYRVEARVDGAWTTVAEVSGNRHRHRIHDLQPVDADALRLTALATAGAPVVTVSALKAYSEPSGRTHAWS
jgi:hypothetical protein